MFVDCSPLNVSLACFPCRKIRRVSILFVFGDYDEEALYFNIRYKCPDCCRKLKYMGRNFKPPPKRDTKRWTLLEKGVRNTRTMPARSNHRFRGRPGMGR